MATGNAINQSASRTAHQHCLTACSTLQLKCIRKRGRSRPLRRQNLLDKLARSVISMAAAVSIRREFPDLLSLTQTACPLGTRSAPQRRAAHRLQVDDRVSCPSSFCSAENIPASVASAFRLASFTQQRFAMLAFALRDSSTPTWPPICKAL